MPSRPISRLSPSLLLAALLLVAPLLVAGCGTGAGGADRSASSGSAAAKQVAGPGRGSAAANVAASAESADGTSARADAPPKADLPRKIIYTGQVSLACDDLDRAIEGLEKAVRSVGGYVGDANRAGQRGAARTATYTVRVASDRFDAFLKSLPGLGEFESSTRTAQDVSEEFYDAAARLKNKRVEEARLIDLLKRVAGNLDQILRVETELSRVRGEVEEIEGRLRFLAHQSDLSTVTVTLREAKNFVPEGPPTFAKRAARTWTGSLDALGEFAAGLALLAVGLAPWALPLALVAFVALTVVRRRRRPRPPVVRSDE